MLSAAKVYLSSITSSLSGKSSSNKKKPPPHKRNKHLRRKKPSVFSRIWSFIAARVGWKRALLACILFNCIIIAICQVAYNYSPVEPFPINDFQVEEPSYDRQPYEMNRALQMAKRIRAIQKVWPTAVESDKYDNLFVATSTGAILKIAPSKEGLMGEGELNIIRQGRVENITLPLELLDHFMGKPIALRYVEGTGLLFVLDAAYGLYIVSTQTKITNSLLPISFNGTGMMAPTSFALSEQGTDIYITDFSTKWNDYYFMYQILEGNCTGRLLKFDFSSGDLQVLIDDLCAPTGVEITSNDTTLLITEAMKPRIRTVNLDTIKSMYTVLPGFPARPRLNPRGGCWIPITVVNKGFFDMVNPRKWLRKLLAGLLPPFYLKELATNRHTILIEVDPEGGVIDSLHDDIEVKLFEVSEVKEGRRGQLIIVSPAIEHITKLTNPDNQDETKTPRSRADRKDDEFQKMLRKEQEEMSKELIFDPEPDGFVNEKLIGEDHIIMKDSPRDIASGWFDKAAKEAQGGDSDKKQAPPEKKEL